MTSQKSSFIQSLFRLLKAEEYVLLKWWGQDLQRLPIESDLDILVRPNTLNKIDTLIQQASDLTGFQTKQHIGVRHYYLYFKNGDFLQIDLLTQFIRKNIVYLQTEEVFKSTQIIKGIKTYSLDKLFEHVVLFNFLNYSGLPEKYIQFFHNISASKLETILHSFNKKYNTSIIDLTNFGYSPTTRRTLKKHISQYKENRFFNRMIHGFKFANFSWRSLGGKNGSIITFSGVDGAGKSTILQDTLNLLEGKFRKQVVVLRHRPSLLPILSAWKYGKEQAEQRSVDRLPRQGTNASTFSSLIRFGYYYLDYFLGQIYIWAKYVLRGKVVLYDRYYYDFIIDSKRSNISLPSELPKKLFTFLQKPSLNFFLYADAATILKRKKELPAQHIEELTKGYQSLFQEFSKKHTGQYIPIYNTEKKRTLAIIEQYLIQQMV